MKKIISLALLAMGLSITAQTFSGLELVQITSERLDFNVINKINLSTDNDTLIQWSVNPDEKRYKKSQVNRIEEYQDLDDSLVYTIIDFDHNGWKKQERIVKDKLSRIITHEVITREEYQLTKNKQGVIYEYVNNPSKEYWLKGWRYSSGDIVTESTEDEEHSYNENKMTIEEKIMVKQNPLMKDRQVKLFNPQKLCLYIHKACTPIERTEVYSDPSEEHISFENYLITSKNGRIEDVYSTNGRDMFSELKGFLFEAKGASRLWLEYSNGDVQEIPVNLIIPFEVNSFYE